jgi:hypothetical protein
MPDLEIKCLDDLIPTLSNPEAYFRGVIGNMHSYRKEHGSANVRFGIKGAGVSPHYRFDPDNATSDIQHSIAYGRNHKNLNFLPEEMIDANWTPLTWTYEDVQTVLAKVTGFKKKVPK